MMGNRPKTQEKRIKPAKKGRMVVTKNVTNNKVVDSDKADFVITSN